MKRSTWTFVAFSVALVLWGNARSARADELTEISLMAGWADRVELPAGQGVVSGEIWIDPASVVDVLFGSPRRDLEVTLTSPSGDGYVMSLGVGVTEHGFAFPGADAPNPTGANYAFHITSPEPGIWHWRIEDGEPRSAASAVFINAFSDSPIRSAILGGGTEYPIGRDLTLATLVMDGGDPVTGYVAKAEVWRDGSSAPVASLVFLDDASDGDATADDGVATAIFSPGAEGIHVCRATIEGLTAAGVSFTRTVETTFRVVAEKARLGGMVDDRAVDADGDGLLDELGVSVPVTVVEAGNYLVQLTLTSQSGQTLNSHALGTLGTGSGFLEVFFAGTDLRGWAEDGPYNVTDVVLEYIGADNALVADRKDTLGATRAWRFSQFERAAIESLGVVDSFGVDADANGLFDSLEVRFAVDLQYPGFYNWSARLVDASDTELGFAFGSGSVSGVSTISLAFPGLPIGEHGADGPFYLNSLVIYGAGRSLIENSVGATAAFDAAQFEGYVEPDQEPPDLQLAVTPQTPWPPNHQMVELHITWDVADNMDPNPLVRLESVTSSDGENEIGDGHHSPDIEVTEDGRVFVRAERAGPKKARYYTITFSARDGVGNLSTAAVVVTVPHDRR